ncbi:unnamed protein product [Phytomonas sp. Hart1]|nr:unnamed protein product [Phytomonas sp. Hart1]|eukprot:CCW69708.1 unnamed protein product [Phytomonas sp. isolate Hart1]
MVLVQGETPTPLRQFGLEPADSSREARKSPFFTGNDRSLQELKHNINELERMRETEDNNNVRTPTMESFISSRGEKVVCEEVADDMSYKILEKSSSSPISELPDLTPFLKNSKLEDKAPEKLRKRVDAVVSPLLKPPKEGFQRIRPTPTPPRHPLDVIQEKSDPPKRDSPNAVSSLLDTPSERISVEVKELVERAQIEVRRTRESLLNYLSTHKKTALSNKDTAAVNDPVSFDLSAFIQPIGKHTLEIERGEGVVRRRLEPDKLAEGVNEKPLPLLLGSTSEIRVRLRENAGRILRRLQGYDRRDHGVLPMEVIISVIFSILHPQWRGSSPERRGNPFENRGSISEAMLSPPPALSFHHQDFKQEEHTKRLRGELKAAGRSATVLSPTRTLEQVMARCADPKEEAMLDFYQVFLKGFQEVFGERYAWRHLGVTNASRHDIMTLPLAKGKGDGRCGANNKGNYGRKIVDLNDIEGSLEEVFPRLRQHYSFKSDSSGRAVDPRRPPPLDTLVYYKRLIASLEEL